MVEHQLPKLRVVGSSPIARFMRRAAAATVVGLLGLTVAFASAGAALERDELIRPGVGIAKIRLGMSAAQLRAAMGRPLSVLPQKALFGRTAVEWQYGYGAYTVRLEGRRNALRVVRVTTTVFKERTREGFGVGTLESRLQQALGSRLRCELLRTRVSASGLSEVLVVADPHRDCVVTSANGARTVFRSWVKPDGRFTFATPERWKEEARVLEVAVQT